MANEMNLQQSDLTQVTPHTADGSNDIALIAVGGSESDSSSHEHEHENGQVRVPFPRLAEPDALSERNKGFTENLDDTPDQHRPL